MLRFIFLSLIMSHIFSQEIYISSSKEISATINGKVIKAASFDELAKHLYDQRPTDIVVIAANGVVKDQGDWSADWIRRQIDEIVRKAPETIGDWTLKSVKITHTITSK